MQSEQQARKKKAHLTPYIRPAVSFVATEKPEWLRAREEAGRGRPRFDSAKMDSFVSGTPANIIAQQFADQQTAAADAKREKERGLRQHERCSTFWEAAHAGVFPPVCQCLVLSPFFSPLSIPLSVLGFSRLLFAFDGLCQFQCLTFASFLSFVNPCVSAWFLHLFPASSIPVSVLDFCTFSSVVNAANVEKLTHM